MITMLMFNYDDRFWWLIYDDVKKQDARDISLGFGQKVYCISPTFYVSNYSVYNQTSRSAIELIAFNWCERQESEQNDISIYEYIFACKYK